MIFMINLISWASNRERSVVSHQLDLIQTLSMTDDSQQTIQKPHIDLYHHQKKHLGDDSLFESPFPELKAVILTIRLYILMDRR